MNEAQTLIDSHCHLTHRDFAEDAEAAVARAHAAGVGGMIVIGTKLKEAPIEQAFADAHANVWCSIGSHPEYAAEEETPVAEIIEKSRHAKTVGIGESGLDFFYSPETREPQVKNFLQHIEASRETQIPVIIHTRAADPETIEILNTEQAKGSFPGVLHCFSGGRELAECALSHGMYISVSGIATFKKAQPLRDILRDVPLDKLLVETDAPYLAPVPKRGGRNEPALVTYTAALTAELKGISPAELAVATTENFFRLFRKAKFEHGA